VTDEPDSSPTPTSPMVEDPSSPDGNAGGDPEESRRTRRATVFALTERLITPFATATRPWSRARYSLSQRSRWLAPLALVVGAFAMLFQGVKLLVTNWRLTLVQILPAMWIWAAMLDLKIHALHGKEFHIVRGPVLIPSLLAMAGNHGGQFLSQCRVRLRHFQARHPEIRPAFAQARTHLRPILRMGFRRWASLSPSRP
jgi:hypothetical protein